MDPEHIPFILAFWISLGPGETIHYLAATSLLPSAKAFNTREMREGI
jgi:hypothetical protein